MTKNDFLRKVISKTDKMSNLNRLFVEFSGGCELLFGNQPRIDLSGKVAAETTIGDLVLELRNNYIQERPEQFAIPVEGGASGAVRLRPGVLALVNDCDAEVLGGEEYVIQDGDVVAFISTLHGG